MKLNNKKGELTSQQIVTIIILIIGFAVIVFFLVELNLNSQVNTESCRNSVILRGSALGKATSLNCQTQDVCISDGGTCSNVGSNVVTVDVSSKTDVESALSNLMYDCWYEMGEGKVDYLPTNFGAGPKNYCAICDRVYFDNKLQANTALSQISALDFYTYLSTEKTPDGSDTMLHYLYGFSTPQSAIDAYEQGDDTNGVALPGDTFDFANPSGYALVTSIAKTGWGPTLLTGVTVGAVIILTAGEGAALIPIIAAGSGTAVSGTVAYYFTGPGATTISPPSLYPNNANSLNQLGCYEFSTLP